MKLHTLFILGSFLLIYTTCKKKDVEPGTGKLNKDATISAIISDTAFNGNQVTKSYKKAFTINASDGSASITIGTDFPPTEGKFTLNKRDPFSGKNYYATYVNNGKTEYRTQDNGGTLEISKVRIDNNDVKELKGTFSFKATSSSNKEIEITNGNLNFKE